MELKITDNVTEQDKTEIFRGLLEYKLSKTEDREPRELGVYCEDAQRRRLAGLVGETHGSWLTIELLWVDETLKRRHMGSAILDKAEAAAKERGCKYVFVDTFDFQAPEFYRKHGYTEVFTLNHYPRTGKRHNFTKELWPHGRLRQRPGAHGVKDAGRSAFLQRYYALTHGAGLYIIYKLGLFSAPAPGPGTKLPGS